MTKFVQGCVLFCTLLVSIPVAFSASSATEFDTDTKIMLHLDGSDASTTITDSSDSAQTATAVADAQIDTAQSKFGGASLLLDGTGDKVDVTDSADFDLLATDPFTIDLWVRFSALTDHDVIVDRGGTSDFSLVRSSDGTLDFYLNGALVCTTTWNPNLNQWYHLAMVKSGNGADQVYLFIDGTSMDTGTHNSAISSANNITLGSTNAGAHFVTGWIDEFRFVKGTAVWTSNFTPPNAAYTEVGAGTARRVITVT